MCAYHSLALKITNIKIVCIWNILVGMFDVYVEFILGCLILTWYFYEGSQLITNCYHYWQVLFFKSLLSKFERYPFINLQDTVSESNQSPNFLQRWKKGEFHVLIEHYFLRRKTLSETKAKLDKYYSDSAPSYGMV